MKRVIVGNFLFLLGFFSPFNYCKKHMHWTIKAIRTIKP